MWKVSCKSSWWGSSTPLSPILASSSIFFPLSSCPHHPFTTFPGRPVSFGRGGPIFRRPSANSILVGTIPNPCQSSTSTSLTTRRGHSYFPVAKNSLSLVSQLRLLTLNSRGGLFFNSSYNKQLLLTRVVGSGSTLWDSRTSLFVTSCTPLSQTVSGGTTGSRVTPTPGKKTSVEGGVTGIRIGSGKVKFGGGERRLTSSYPFPKASTPTTDTTTTRSRRTRIVGVNSDGSVVEREVDLEDEINWREELRSGNHGRGPGFESSVVAMGTGISPGSAPRTFVSTEEIASIAQEYLGKERFSTQLSLSHNFGQFQDIITLFLFKVAHIDHPLLYITKIIESEPSQSLKTDVKNPYPLWRAMMILLTTEMYGFPRDIARAPEEVIRTIKEKHNRVAKIAEVSWVAHQLHRRILDIDSEATPSRLNENEEEDGGGVNPKPTKEDLHKSNKSATLVGDLLLTQMCAHMAALKSPIVTDLVCTALSDFCESEFELGVRPCPPRQFNYETWLQRSEQDLGSLLGHCLYSALLFSGFDSATLTRSFRLGSLLGILYQAYDDISFFNRDDLTNPSWLDVGTLPVVYQIQNHPEFLTKSHSQIFHAIKSPTNPVMAQALETFYFIQDRVLKELTSYDDLENITARDILINFVHSMNPLQSTSI